jgi:phosphoglycolate phosphatase-like HAD superfamily hydrolase
VTRLVLFDIDGTILLSDGAGRRAIVAALANRYGACEAWGTIRFDGKTDPQILGELLAAGGHGFEPSPEHLADLGRDYVAELERQLARPGHRTTIMPGIHDLLDRVEATEGAVLGLLTGNFVEGAGLKLRSGGIDPVRFKVGAYGSDSAVRSDLPPIAAKRAAELFGRVPSGHEVVIVGDTPADVACGRSIGARAIAVATGYYSVPELEAAGAVAAFENLSDTAAVMDAIFG